VTTKNDRAFGVIFLGASRFIKEGLDNPAFATSKTRVADVLTNEFLSAEQVVQLDMFDQERTPAAMVDDVSSFLDAHKDVTDLIIYYCGHGGFLPDQSYYLALRGTREGREATTGLQLKQFWIDLEDVLAGRRIYVVLDCCFAAAALRTWMSDNSISKMIVDQTEAGFPHSGTVLLAAASPKIAAIAPEGRATTLFSGHFADAIRAGIKGGPKMLSLIELAQSIRERILLEPLKHRVMPSLLAPHQEQGDVSLIPFVRNHAVISIEKNSKGASNWGPYGPIQFTYTASKLDFGVSHPAAQASEPSLSTPHREARRRQRSSGLWEGSKSLVNQLIPFFRNLTFRPYKIPDTLSKALFLAVGVAGACSVGAILALQYWPRPPLVDSPASSKLEEARSEEVRVEQSPIASDPAAQGVLVQEKPVENVILEAVRVQQDIITPTVARTASSDLAPEKICSSSMLAPNVGAVGVGGGFNPFAIRPLLPAAAVEPIRSIAFSPDGKKFATAGDDGAVRVWDVSSFKIERILLPKHENKAYSVAFSQDGSRLASASWDGTVRIWNAASGGLIQTLEAESGAKQYAVAFSPEIPPKYVASGGDDGLINIWNLGASRKKSSSKSDHRNATRDRRIIHSLSYSLKTVGEFISGGFDGKIVYYFFVNGHSDEISMDAHAPDRVFKVSYSPNDERVASVGGDRMLKLWVAKDRKLTLVRKYEGHKERVVSVAWSPDGKRLLSGAGGKDPIHMWDVEGGHTIRTYSGHQKDVEAVAFHPVWPRIVSGSEDGTMKVWDANSSKELFTVIPFTDGQYLVYTSDGCYTGSPGVERHFKLIGEGKEIALTQELKNALFVPDGVGRLLAGR
jgi:WD40 repeat protein